MKRLEDAVSQVAAERLPSDPFDDEPRQVQSKAVIPGSARLVVQWELGEAREQFWARHRIRHSHSVQRIDAVERRCPLVTRGEP